MLIKICLIFLCTMYPQMGYCTAEDEGITQEQRAFLEDDSENEPAHPSTAPNMNSLLIKTIILLSGLCGLVIAGAYFLRRLGGTRFNSFSTDGSIRLVERKYLSPKTSLWLVEVHKQTFLVVDSQQQSSIQPLTTTPPKEAPL